MMKKAKTLSRKPKKMWNFFHCPRHRVPTVPIEVQRGSFHEEEPAQTRKEGKKNIK